MNVRTKKDDMIINKRGEAPKALSEVLLVGIDDNGEDKFTMVVGKKDTVKKETEILNIITGSRARQIYTELLHAISIPEVE